jgi:hypothetical protein
VKEEGKPPLQGQVEKPRRHEEGEEAQGEEEEKLEEELAEVDPLLASRGEEKVVQGALLQLQGEGPGGEEGAHEGQGHPQDPGGRPAQGGLLRAQGQGHDEEYHGEED